MAFELQFSDVDVFLSQITSSQLVEWQHFYQLEPFGRLVDELHIAAIRTQMGNYLRGKNQPAIKLRDVLLSYVAPEPEKSVEELYRILLGNNR